VRRLGWRWGTYDTFGLSLALLEGVLVLELGSHIDGFDIWYLAVGCFRCDERESWGVSWRLSYSQ
jgi:hypothetical protein